MKKTTKKAATTTTKKKTQVVPVSKTCDDVKHAVLVMSLLINVFFLSIWVVLNTTNTYDTALFNFFINR